MRATRAVCFGMGFALSLMLQVVPVDADPYYANFTDQHCHSSAGRSATINELVSRRLPATPWIFAVDSMDGDAPRPSWLEESNCAQRAAERWNNVTTPRGCPRHYLLDPSYIAVTEPNLRCSEHDSLTFSWIVFVENYTDSTSKYHWLATQAVWNSGTKASTHAKWNSFPPYATEQAAIYLNAEDYSWDPDCGAPEVAGRSFDALGSRGSREEMKREDPCARTN